MKNLLICTGVVLLLFLSSCGKEATNDPRDDEPAKPSPIEPIARVVPDIDDNKIRFLYSVSEDGGKTWSAPKAFASLGRGIKVPAVMGYSATPRRLRDYSFQFKGGVVYLTFSTSHGYTRLRNFHSVYFEYYFARSDGEGYPVEFWSECDSPCRKGYTGISKDHSVEIEVEKNTVTIIVQPAFRKEQQKLRSDDGGKTWKKV